MKIGLDLDNVIVDIISSARAVTANDHSLEIDEVIETNVYWDPFTHADPSIAARLRPEHSFWDRPDVLLAAPCLPGALESVERLHREGLLACYITRRPPSVDALTLRWLRENGFPDVPVAHVGNSDKAFNFERCKSSACLEHGVTHMVDDQPHEIETLMLAGISSILVDAPVGRDKRHEFMKNNPSIPVARDISHAVEMLMEGFAEAA